MNKRFFRPGTFRKPEPQRTGVADVPNVEAAIDAMARKPMHDPPLEPRDEAVFLLTAAAEIEHALMVQYLFAAYSVRVPAGGISDERKLQALLAQIAREEMGHLMTVQNLLHLLGGPLNFNREHSPYASDIYPFRFKLEPLSLHTLAKYVVAESPASLPEHFKPEDRALYAEMEKQARQSNDGRAVGHVGPIFARLKELLAAGTDGVRDEDFRLETVNFGGRDADWGFSPGNVPGEDAPLGEPLIVVSFEGKTVAEARAAALGAVSAIGEQGEGFDLPEHGPGEAESHFERFFLIYKRLQAILTDPARQPVWPVAENPNTTLDPEEIPNMMRMVEMVQEAHAEKGRIRNARARAWAQLFDLRYRMLLTFLSHFLRRDDALSLPPTGEEPGIPTPRGLLAGWTFREMGRLRRIAGKLVQLPKDDAPGSLHAGPPFGLPYTLNLPEHEPSRWRVHLDTSRAAVRLIRERLLADGSVDAAEPFLTDLVRLDEEMQSVLQSLATGGERSNGGGPPAGGEREPDPEEPPPVPQLPTSLSFATDIMGLFRARPDRSSMLAIGGFDLHRYEDVRDRADRILATLEDGSMPCDGAWPPDRIATFREWIAQGKQP